MKSNGSPRALMIAKTAVMLEMQDGMNARVDHDWLERERQWYRAIWIECAELMEHYGGWKWWKRSPQDVEQVMLEVVDIWHFGLSMQISADRAHTAVAERIVDEWLGAKDSHGFLGDVERLAGVALQDKAFLIATIPMLLKDIGRGFDDLYRAYVGKNVLNYFRQDHGYRDGTYVKNWDGREDNEHLVDILSVLDADDPTYRDRIYAELARAYPAAPD